MKWFVGAVLLGLVGVRFLLPTPAPEVETEPSSRVGAIKRIGERSERQVLPTRVRTYNVALENEKVLDVIRRNHPEGRDWDTQDYSVYRNELYKWVVEVETELKDRGIHDFGPLAASLYESDDAHVRYLAMRWAFSSEITRADAFDLMVQFSMDPLLSIVEETPGAAQAEVMLSQIMVDTIVNNAGFTHDENTTARQILSLSVGGQRVLHQMRSP
jgi:hypothetical protein